MSLFLHGVVRADHPSAAAHAKLVTWQDLAVVVSEARAPTQEDALAHLELLSALVVDGPVVPLKYGTTAVGEEAARMDVLAASATRLRAHLDRLAGLVELHAYLRFDEDEALQAVYEEHHTNWQVAGGLSTRILAGEQVAQHLVAWRRTRSDALLAPVAAVAREQASLPDREHTEERRAFLLPHKEIEPARAAITALKHIAGVDAECVAPLPAYNFLTEPANAPTPGTSSRWGW
jgi:hypothetical protein